MSDDIVQKSPAIISFTRSGSSSVRASDPESASLASTTKGLGY
jgi:hypothetical protein